MVQPTPTLFYASQNPGKVMEVSRFFQPHGLTVISPRQLNLNLDVAESGQSLEENARLKALAYSQTPAAEYPILADDTGVEIKALNGEPGIKVRRWIGRHMTDQEIISHCLARMNSIPPGQRQARFRTVLALMIKPTAEVEYFSGYLQGEIVQNPPPLRHPGLPFEVLFFVPEYQKMLFELHDDQRESQEWLSHRGRALTAALPRLKQLLTH